MSTAATTGDHTRFGLLILLFGGGVTDRMSTFWDGLVSGFLVLVRFFVALPFFLAGLARINSWNVQSFLFESEHPLPLLPPMTAATITTAAELILPVFLVLGLFGRLAGLGLAVMAATILFVVGGAFALPAEQVPWIVAGLTIAVLGPGRISLDNTVSAALDRQERLPVVETLIALFLVLVLFEKTNAWSRLFGLAAETTTPLGWFF